MKLSKKAQGLPMQTIVLVILVVIAIAIVLIFTFGVTQTGTEQAQEQTQIGTTSAELANCRLWASGLNPGFDCKETSCPQDVVCDACEYYGFDEETGDYLVDNRNCKEFSGCNTCK